MNTKPPTAQTRSTWRKSSYSTATGNCVEVAPATDGVTLQHSKRPTAGTIAFPHHAWATFVRAAAEDLTSTNGIATITRIGTDTLVTSLITDVELHFNAGEWSTFVAGAANGEFDFTGELTTAS